MEGCFVCQKHQLLGRWPGGALLADEHVVVTHRAPGTSLDPGPAVHLGHLLVEPRRHVPELGGLSAVEAASLGALAAQAAAALTAAGAEHVYAAVIGHGVDHLHLHLLARWAGTPREYWWTAVDEWPDAPRGDAEGVAAFVARLRGYLPDV